MTIDFRLLGALELRHRGGEDVRSILAQPRRLALLAYLTLRSARGAEQRDTLLGVFWPESDASHARGALRNALHYLRRSLGADVVVSLGEGGLAVNLDVIHSDVVEFEKLLDEGLDEEALELYRGDLLEGFFISEAPEFERWVHAERGRLRNRAVGAATRMAEKAEAEGQLGLAAHHMRHALTLSGDNELLARHLISLLARTEDRSGALQAYEEFAARVRARYGIEPSANTRALAETLRKPDPSPADAGPAGTDSHGADDSATHDAPTPTAHAPNSDGMTEARQPPQAPAVRVLTSAPPKKRVGRWGLVAGLSTAALGLLAISLLSSRSREVGVTPSRDLVAVFPFSYQGSEEFAFLGKGIVNLLAANLDGVGELRSVDSGSILRSLEAIPRQIQDPGAAANVARRFGAGSFVLGEITEARGELRVGAALYGRKPFGLGGPTRVVVKGRSEDLLELVDRLTERLLGLPSGTRVVRRASRATENLEALKEFLRGEDAARAGRFDEAVEHYQEATRADSSFALAYYRLSTSAYAGGRAGIPVLAARSALRHASRLSRDDSLLVTAWSYHLNGAVDSAERYYRTVVTVRPSNAEAWEQLGELAFHWGPSLGQSPLEAREAFEWVVALEPSRVEATAHLARLAAREGKTAELDSLALVVRAYDATARWTLELESLRAFLSGERGREEGAIRAVAADPERARHILTSLAANTYNLEASLRLARTLMSSSLPPSERAKIQLILVQLLMAGGHLHEADATLRASDLLPAARVLEYRAMAASLPFAPVGMDERDSLWRAVEEVERDVPPPPETHPIWWRSAEFPPVLWPSIYSPRRDYLLGMLSLRLGDAATARRFADSLKGRGEGEASLSRRLAAVLQAEAARRVGDSERALAILLPLPLPARPAYEHLLDYPRSYERYLRGEVYQELGKASDAIRWYSTFPDPAGHDLPLMAPSHLNRAEIYDRLGNRVQAAFHYERFLKLWKDVDPELEGMVAHARQRLAALR